MYFKNIESARLITDGEYHARGGMDLQQHLLQNGEISKELSDQITQAQDAGVVIHLDEDTQHVIESLFKKYADQFLDIGIYNATDLLFSLKKNQCPSFFGAKNIIMFDNGTEVISGFLEDKTPKNVTEILKLRNTDKSAINPEIPSVALAYLYALRNHLDDERGAVAANLVTTWDAVPCNNGKRFSGEKPGTYFRPDDELNSHVESCIQLNWCGVRLELVRKADGTIVNFEDQPKVFQDLVEKPHDEQTDSSHWTEVINKDGKDTLKVNLDLNIAALTRIMEQRMTLVIEASIMRAEALGKKAYVRFDGAGTGVWAGPEGGFKNTKDYTDIKRLFTDTLISVAAKFRDHKSVSHIEATWLDRNFSLEDFLSIDDEEQSRGPDGICMFSPMKHPHTEEESVLCATFAGDPLSKNGNEGRYQSHADRPMQYQNASNEPAAVLAGRAPEEAHHFFIHKQTEQQTVLNHAYFIHAACRNSWENAEILNKKQQAYYDEQSHAAEADASDTDNEVGALLTAAAGGGLTAYGEDSQSFVATETARQRARRLWDARRELSPCGHLWSRSEVQGLSDSSDDDGDDERPRSPVKHR